MELTLEETPRSAPGRASSALYARDGQTRVIVPAKAPTDRRPAKRTRGNRYRHSNASGKNAVTGDLHEGDSVKKSCARKVGEWSMTDSRARSRPPPPAYRYSRSVPALYAG